MSAALSTAYGTPRGPSYARDQPASACSMQSSPAPSGLSSELLRRQWAVVARAPKSCTIGTFDTLMAAHALSLGVTFVTNNTQHFGRVVGLRIENWA